MKTFTEVLSNYANSNLPTVKNNTTMIILES